MMAAAEASQAAPDEAEFTRRILRLLALAALLFAIRYLTQIEERMPVFASFGVARTDRGYFLLLIAGLGAVFLRGQRLRFWLAAVSTVAIVHFLRRWGVYYLAYCVAIVGIGRLPIKLRFQLLLALVAWSVLPVWKWQFGEQFPVNNRTMFVGILWAQAAYASVYLLVERARARKERPSVIDDLTYLTLLPRLVEPFFQPLSPKYMFSVESPTAQWRQLGRAMGLGLFGLALGVAVHHLQTLKPEVAFFEPLAIAHAILLFYCAFAGQCFVSMALIRFLGFDVASGMKQPFLSRSFREFFRRWNHYIRDAVVTLFLFPLQGWLRKRFSPRVARALAAYGAIIIGSLILNDILVPTVTAYEMSNGIEERASIRRLLIHVIYWSAIILPKAGLEVTAEHRKAGWQRRAFETARFLVGFGLVWYLSKVLGEKLM